MKITRKGDEVEIRRNKRRGLKLIAKEGKDEGKYCYSCYFWGHTDICKKLQIDGDGKIPCEALNKLNKSRKNYYFILKNENNNRKNNNRRL